MMLLVLVTLLLLLLYLARLVRTDGYGVNPPPADRRSDGPPNRPYALGR